jgi:hypothetical protein
MKKYFVATVFLIVNLFFLHSKSLCDDGENWEYSPYSYNYQTYSMFPSEDVCQPFSSEKEVDYNLINYELGLRQAIGTLPPGFEDYDSIGTESSLPVGNLMPLLLFSGIYVCRIILKKKKKK